MSNTNNLQPFVPAQVGFKASYNIDFSSDPVQVINLTGSIQGDPAVIRSLHINNINNPSVVTCTFAGDDSTVPAYSDGYVNVDGQAYVTLTCYQPAQISVDVMTARQAPGFVARGLAPGGNTAAFTAGENIQKGDIVTQGTDGLAYWGNDPANNDTVHAINGTAVGPYAQSNKLPIGTTIGGSSPSAVRYERIGNYIYCFAATGSQVNFYRLSLDGTLLVSALDIVPGYGTFTGTYSKPDFISFKGDIVVCFGTSSGAAGKAFCILSLDSLTLAVKIQPSFFGGNYTGGSPHVTMCIGWQGNLAIAYYNGQNTFAAVYTTGLTILYGPVTIQSGGAVQTGYSADIVDIEWSNTGGCYVIVNAWYDGTAYNLRLGIWSSGLGAVNSTSGVGINSTTPIFVKCLSQTGYIIQYNGQTYMYQYSNTAFTTVGGLGGLVPGKGAIYDNGTTMVMATAYNTSLTFGQVSNTTYAFVAGTTTVLTIPAGTVSGVGGYIQNNDYVVLLSSGSGVASYVFGSNLNGSGASFGSGTYRQTQLNFFCSCDNGSSFSFAVGVNLNNWISYHPAVRPMGVALGAATKGQVVTVQINGNAQIRLNFKSGYSVNAQASNPPGQKMNIVGNAATMFGIQS